MRAGACGPFVSYLAGAGACGGLDQIVADPKAQQLAVDVDIAALPGVVAPDADLLPGHAHDPVGGDATADPVVAAAVGAGHRLLRWWARRNTGAEPLGRCGYLQ